MSRSVWKGPFVDGHLLKKVQNAMESGKKEVIKKELKKNTIAFKKLKSFFMISYFFYVLTKTD